MIATTENLFWNNLIIGQNEKAIGLPANIEFVPMENKNNFFYEYNYELYLNKVWVADFYCGEKGQLRFKIDNPVRIEIRKNILYQSRLKSRLDAIFDLLNLKFYKYDNAEIAIDGYGLLERMRALLHARLYHRKQPLENVSEIKHDSEGWLKSIRSGSDKSDKLVTVYAKQLLLLDKEAYIGDFWKRNGLVIVPEKQIDRSELRLWGKEANLLSTNFNDLVDPRYLASFVKQHAGRYFEYIHNYEPKKRRHVIQWNKFDSIELTKPVTNKVGESKEAIKRTIKQLYFQHILTGNETYYLAYTNLERDFGLSKWKKLSCRKWDNDKKLRFSKLKA
ncbi:MAG: hypothetical protein IPN99_12670 [Bacteroidetes bacterium]|nr:hypothetical protein [Bacteroidota bacterium]